MNQHAHSLPAIIVDQWCSMDPWSHICNHFAQQSQNLEQKRLDVTITKAFVSNVAEVGNWWSLHVQCWRLCNLRPGIRFWTLIGKQSWQAGYLPVHMLAITLIIQIVWWTFMVSSRVCWQIHMCLGTGLLALRKGNTQQTCKHRLLHWELKFCLIFRDALILCMWELQTIHAQIVLQRSHSPAASA